MKYSSIFLFALFLLTSCGNNEDEIFEMSYDIIIPFEAGLTQFEAHFVDNFGINTRIDEFLAASGRSREDLTSILPKSAELANINTNVSLDFIDNIVLTIFDGTELMPDIKENEKEIFFRNNVPQDRSIFIDLLPSLPDVKDQLVEDRFNFTVRTVLRVPPPNTVEARLRLRFSAQ